MRFGGFDLFSLSDGRFALDGGSMFGVVPRVLWEKRCTPDNRNRIVLGLNPLLVDTGNELILIDTGIGNKFEKKFKDIYFIDKSTDLISSLRARGFEASDIEIVLLTHLHFDHAGGNTRRDKDNTLIPTFPNARYFVQQSEWNAANNPDTRSRASYLKENFSPLGSNLELIIGDTEITEGIKTILTSGHTQGHQCVQIESDSNTAIYFGDLIPTSSHLRVPYVMSYDLYPLVTMEQKEKLLKQVVRGNWMVIFEHDPRVNMAYIQKENDRLICKPLHE